MIDCVRIYESMPDKRKSSSKLLDGTLNVFARSFTFIHLECFHLFHQTRILR